VAVFKQRPGVLDLEMISGDEFAFTATFELNLSGYTLTSGVYKVSDSSLVVTPTLTITTGSTSTVKVSLTETQTTSIFDAGNPSQGTPRERMRWWLRWVDPTGYTRMALSGNVVIGVS
jgi:hypothetical protein